MKIATLTTSLIILTRSLTTMQGPGDHSTESPLACQGMGGRHAIYIPHNIWK